MQRKIFGAAGRFWAFWGEGLVAGAVMFSSSADGLSWLEDEEVPQLTSTTQQVNGNAFALVTDGTYVYIAFGMGSRLRHKRGELHADGTITWDSAVYVTTWLTFYPSIARDSNGLLWILFIRSGYDRIYWVRSTNTSGSSWGTPAILRSTDIGRYGIVALTGGKMYAAYTIGNFAPFSFYGKLYDGAWGSEETVTTDGLYLDFKFSPVARGDRVDIIYSEYGTEDIHHTYRTTGWQPPLTVKSAATGTTNVALSICGASYLYAFWVVASIIYLQIYDGSSWRPSEQVLFDSEVAVWYAPASCYVDWNGWVFLEWTSGITSPYDVRFGGASAL